MTELTDGNGGAVRITDFAPRFHNYGRTFRPPQLVRIIEPIAGMPRIMIRFRPTHRYGVPLDGISPGSNIFAIGATTYRSPDHRCAALLYRE